MGYFNIDGYHGGAFVRYWIKGVEVDRCYIMRCMGFKGRSGAFWASNAIYVGHLGRSLGSCINIKLKGN